MPEPIATWNPARDAWETGQGLFCGHSAVFSETWPISGMTRGGVAFELPTWAPRTPGSGTSLLPTPAAYDGERGGPQDPDKRKAGGHSVSLQDQVSTLLPTPTATPYGSNQSPSEGAAVRPSLDAIGKLLPTPKTTDSHSSSPADMNRNEPGLRAIKRLLPTPTAADEHSSGAGSSTANTTLTDAVVRTRLGARMNPRFDDGNESSGDLLLPLE